MTKSSRAPNGLSAEGILSVAVSDWLLNGNLENKDNLKEFLSEWKQKYLPEPRPYSYTNDNPILGAIPIGLWAKDICEARQTARFMAAAIYPTRLRMECAEAVATAVFMTYQGIDKGQIKTYFENEFGYDLEGDDTSGATGRNHKQIEQALLTFLRNHSFRQTLNAVISSRASVVVACIACAMAEAYHGIPFLMLRKTVRNLPEDILMAAIGIQDQRKLRKSTLRFFSSLMRSSVR